MQFFYYLQPNLQGHESTVDHCKRYPWTQQSVISVTKIQPMLFGGVGLMLICYSLRMGSHDLPCLFPLL